MKLYNTLSRSIEDFKPLDENLVKMYTCGPTVYNYAHIGNLRTYIHEDILEKTLIYLGYPVKRVMNITDVGHLESDADDGEDKMLKGAKRENKTVWEIAQHYTDAFFSDLEKLNIKKADVIGKATDYIDDYIEFIKTLENKGYTYIANGNVYFDITKRDDYTKLSGMDLEQCKTAYRENVSEDLHKKCPQDFVLWFTKSKFDNQAMKWDSPWGVGYPGWHIECSVISLKNLGEQMDIHCGGVDHIPVHHTNEIAQTESYTGKEWVKYWWHGEFLIDNGGKMSKSSGEFLTLSLLEKKGFNPLSYRYYILNSHYRKQLAFSFDSLKSTENAYYKLKNKIKTLKENEDANCKVSDSVNKYINEFKNCLADDLNTANAITVLYNALKSEDLNNTEKLFIVSNFEQVLSLDLLNFDEENGNDVHEDEVKFIEEMIQKRQEAKKNKDFQLADAIRAELLEKGIVLEDTRQGVNWKKRG
ncbi:cysteinyl-tRNA synthetase [Sedimentibacter acidaminivorans]|jgi:cysteinyl-tRNA synthetase|uniref:Cysteine--tRNA ligase n=1 Tax=Sedimentibacter acidaminivorans TaxID=913099 RepID=A0ABS4GI70_9FIRM|nr:cysteine--tRNA ligase [Sedimentibacter acidaminivorans]MBP1927396.1 cysteinyl-tRNA synthetase [Sedimentibacter acidaminivorans]